MTHEHLTQRADFNYSINRMAEAHDTPTGGPGDTGAPGRERTPQGIELARMHWDERIAKTTDPNERQTLMALREMGISPLGGGAEVINPADYLDPALVPFVEGLNNELTDRIDRGESPIPDLDYVSSQLERLERLIDEGRIADLGQATRLQQTLNTWKRESLEVARNDARAETGGRREFNFFTIQQKDLKELDDSPIGWLDNQFDILYSLAQQGQELNSPIVQQVERAFEEASRYVRIKQPNAAEEFNTSFTIRFNLLSSRTTIGYRSIENIQRAATTLGLHGLMKGISMEDGKVGSMFNRLHELLEDERLKNPDHHAKPEVVNRLQDNVIAEQLSMAERGIGQFGNLSDAALEGLDDDQKQESRKQVTKDITRAVRIAYDVFVSSQRQAVIVARGRHLTGDEAYFSDPASGPLNVYNLEDLLIKKFGIYNAHDQEFVKRIKLDMAEGYIAKQKKTLRLTEDEKEDLGTRLFRDLFAVPDFFSSGWRIKGVLDSIDERFIARFEEVEGKEKARDFALFMRLLKAPKAREEAGGESREQVWERIAGIRPEEIVRLYRERAEDDSRLTTLFNNGVFTNYQMTDEDGSVHGIRGYDDFKKEFGPILRLLRENGYRDLRQLKIAKEGFTPEETERIRQYFNEDKAGDIQEMFRLMTGFSQNSITELLNNNKFEDTYTRTLLIDDALLDRLESPEEEGFVPLSKKYATDQGGDALVRNWNDVGNAIQAGQSLIKFIQSENPEAKMKAAEEFGEFTSLYNGQEARAKCIRYTIGTFLSLSKSDFMWDSLGVGKLPFRKAMSEIERIYGPQAMSMSRDQLRVQLDNIHHSLVGALDKNFSSMTPEQQEKEHEKVETFYHDLEKVLEVTGKDMVKRRAFSFLIFLILAGIIETYKVGEETVKTK